MQDVTKADGTQPHVFAEGFSTDPYWWIEAPRPQLPQADVPERADVVVVGSGFTGLSAAITLGSAGRKPIVVEAGDPGDGASTRNTGSMGRTFRHKFSALAKELGVDRAIALYQEVAAAHDYTVGLIRGHGIECHMQQVGRFTAAISPQHYRAMGREMEIRGKHLQQRDYLVAPDDLGREIGFGAYHGGLAVPDTCTIHPGLYQLGLLARAQQAGAAIVANTSVGGIKRKGSAFLVETTRGVIVADEVIVATNGYTGRATPYLRRRLIPFPAYIMATQPLDRALVESALPGGRVFQESKSNPFFMRRSPDGARLLFGGFTGMRVSTTAEMGRRLQAALGQLAPQLASVKVGRVWTGNCAATFDIYPHLGIHDGVHYAMGYCFAGISMGTYLGHKIARRVLGAKDAATAFDGFPFQTRPYHWGHAWFLPIAVAKFNWEDRRAMKQAVSA